MAAHQAPEVLPLQSQARESASEAPSSTSTHIAAIDLGTAKALARHQKGHSLSPPASLLYVAAERAPLPAVAPPIYAQDDVSATGPSASSSAQRYGRSQRSAQPSARPEGQRVRSNSLPLPGKDRVLHALCASPSADTATHTSSSGLRLPPLSYHHVITLHQLQLPRPSSTVPNARTQSATDRDISRQLILPSIQPPITHQSLKELDLIEVLRNPQIRHDVVFDPQLMFRPNYDGQRGARKREAADRYWKAVAAEVERGCRCATWALDPTAMLPCVCDAVGFSSSALDALLHGGRRQAQLAVRRRSVQHRVTAPALAARLPSRIPALVEELRLIFISLLPSSSHRTQGFPAQQISAVLDAELIAQQAEHGLLDVVALTEYLGSALKLHCAPMRDEAVDNMIAMVHRGQIADGLRMCFELLELMKLDIANHQLRTLRPFLLETASDFELKHLYDVHDHVEGASPAFDRTRRWFFNSISATGNTNIVNAVNHGLLELIFIPGCVAGAVQNQTDVSLSASPVAVQVPETLHLDMKRIQIFEGDVQNLSIVCMLLLLYRQLSSTATGRDQISVGDLENIKTEIWVLISQPTPPRRPYETRASRQGLSSPVMSAVPGQGKLENAAWREYLRDAALQIAQRVKGEGLPGAEEQDLVFGWLDKHLTSTSDLYRMVQARLRCALADMLEEQQEAIHVGDIPLRVAAVASPSGSESSADVPLCCVRRDATIFDRRPTPYSSHRSTSSATPSKRPRIKKEEEDMSPNAKRLRVDASLPDPAACLKPLMAEVEVLSERIARVAALHLRVYSGWYAALLNSGLPPTLVIPSATVSTPASEYSE